MFFTVLFLQNSCKSQLLLLHFFRACSFELVLFLLLPPFSLSYTAQWGFSQSSKAPLWVLISCFSFSLCSCSHPSAYLSTCFSICAVLFIFVGLFVLVVCLFVCRQLGVKWEPPADHPERRGFDGGDVWRELRRRRGVPRGRPLALLWHVRLKQTHIIVLSKVSSFGGGRVFHELLFVFLFVLIRLVYHDETCKQLNPMEEGEEGEGRRGGGEGGWQSPRRVFLCPTTLG